MKRKFACFGRLREYLGDVMASTEEEALAIAKLEYPFAFQVVRVCPGGDLGVNSPN